MGKAQTARAFADALEMKHRDNGQPFYVLRDNSPEWMQKAIYAAHDNGGLMPNDFTYGIIAKMSDYIAEALEHDASAEIYEIIEAAADSCIPDYNHERLAWLTSHASRVDILDEYLLECGQPELGIMVAIGEAIRRECEAIGYVLIEAFEAASDELEGAE